MEGVRGRVWGEKKETRRKSRRNKVALGAPMCEKRRSDPFKPEFISEERPFQEKSKGKGSKKDREEEKTRGCCLVDWGKSNEDHRGKKKLAGRGGEGLGDILKGRLGTREAQVTDPTGLASLMNVREGRQRVVPG